jgi:hypothetical protein
VRRGRIPVLAIGLLAACGGGQQPSRAGELTVAFFETANDAGALLLTISGGAVESVTAPGGQQISFSTPAAGTTRVVVLGTLQTGDLLKIRVPDTSQVAAYTARLDQVADKTTFSLLDPSQPAYSLGIHK